MKIGYFTDLHSRADTPEGRSDDFRQAILSKTEQMGDVWNKYGVDLVLFGGDLFHTPDPATSIVNDTFKLLRRWNKDIIATVGNHDYFGFQIRSLKRTALGLAHTTGVLNLVTSSVDGLPNNWSLPGGKINIVATEHTYWLHERPENFAISKPPGVTTQIQIVHGDLFNKSVPWPHITIDSVDPFIQSDVVLSGHIHSGWDAPIVKGGKYYYNPGAVCRLENSGVVRIPRVCILDIADDGSISIEDVYLEVVKHPFKDKASVVRSGTILLKEIAETLQASDIDVVDYKAWMPSAAKAAGMQDEAVERAFSYIERV